MSTHKRTSRRRRIAYGLGASGSGLLAAAFIPMGVASAQTGNPFDFFGFGSTTTDPGLYPNDLETSPDPASDFTGVNDIDPTTTTAGNAPGIFDTQFNLDNSALAAQIDYDIDNKEPFSFGALDGLGSNTVPSTFAPGDTAATGYDPFEDAFVQDTGGTTGTLNGITYADAQSYDYAISQLLPSGEAAQLNSIAETGTGTIVPPTEVPFPSLDNDPAVDFVQLFDPNAVNPVTGAPNDIFGEFATLDDQFLNAFGLGAPLDQFEDLFTSSFVTPGSDALGGLGSGLDGLFGGLGTTSLDGLLGGGTTGLDIIPSFFTDMLSSF